MNILVIGGDKRNVYLSELLKEKGDNVYSIGLNDSEKYGIEECIYESNYIVVPTPFSVDGTNVYMPLCDKRISLEYFFKLVKNKKIFGGNFSEKQNQILLDNKNEVYDFLKNKEFALNNVIPTVEGVIEIILKNINYTIDRSNIAIIGFGKIGKRAAVVLKSLGANIFCNDVSEEEVANIQFSGYNVIKSLRTKNNFDIILNTVPAKVIGKEELSYMDKKALIVDVASMPGGIDFKYAEENGYNVIHALGIPGKKAPLTVAKNMLNIVLNKIK